jgi:rfaE bifunctional protein kinase chain/domain
LIAAAGDDEPGRELRKKLEASNVNAEGLITSSALKTTTKVRILAGQMHSTRQQVIRIDYEDVPLSDRTARQTLNSALVKAISDADAVIISDYNYGVVDESVLQMLRDVSRKRIPVLVDSRFRLASFNGFTSATPNEDEVENLLGQKIEDSKQLEESGEGLRQKLDYKALLVTRGSQGMILLENGVAPLHIKAVGAASPVDVTGAGDTVIATFALALS